MVFDPRSWEFASPNMIVLSVPVTLPGKINKTIIKSDKINKNIRSCKVLYKQNSYYLVPLFSPKFFLQYRCFYCDGNPQRHQD